MELTESTYARFKALDLRDTEVVFLLAISTNKLQRFKMDMDWVLYETELEKFSNSAVAQKRKERMKK